MGVTKAMTRHLAIFTTCPELGYLLPGLLPSISSILLLPWLRGMVSRTF